MTGIFARKALLPTGWAKDVRLQVEAGVFKAVAADAAAAADDVTAGIVIPGLCNAHSHAFQRALAGRTELRSPEGADSFWTWRERMYALAAHLDAAAVEAIACQAYSEMLESGYTAVAEFHYLHAPASGESAARMFDAIANAARTAGIRLTYVPVLYERAGFDAAMPDAHQARFAIDCDAFLAHHAACVGQADDIVTVGIGAHSLRAVSETSLDRIVAAANGAPLHIHVAEQAAEVEQCVGATGKRPVQWLLDRYAVDASWCLVHATHMDQDETQRLAASGAIVCLCPTTEANLGDGVFPLHDYLSGDGRIAIGSDSHVSIDPFEELRWLEYGQRLKTQSRNVAAIADEHVGRELFTRAFDGGIRACGMATGGLVAGAPADLVVLDDTDPIFAGHTDATLLDALVFTGLRSPIERTMVNGAWQVIDRDHRQQEDIRAGFAATLRRLDAEQ